MHTRKGICASMRSRRQRMRAPSSELQVACATVSDERSVDVCRGVRVAPCKPGALWRHVCAANSEWRSQVKIVSQLAILGSAHRQPPSHCAAKAKTVLASELHKLINAASLVLMLMVSLVSRFEFATSYFRSLLLLAA